MRIYTTIQLYKQVWSMCSKDINGSNCLTTPIFLFRVVQPRFKLCCFSICVRFLDGRNGRWRFSLQLPNFHKYHFINNRNTNHR